VAPCSLQDASNYALQQAIACIFSKTGLQHTSGAAPGAPCKSPPPNAEHNLPNVVACFLDATLTHKRACRPRGSHSSVFPSRLNLTARATGHSPPDQGRKCPRSLQGLKGIWVLQLRAGRPRAAATCRSHSAQLHGLPTNRQTDESSQQHADC